MPGHRDAQYGVLQNPLEALLKPLARFKFPESIALEQTNRHQDLFSTGSDITSQSAFGSYL